MSYGLWLWCFIKTVSGKQLVFVTNNSTKSRADYKKKFDKLGIPAEVVGGVSYGMSRKS
jgi:ribonucleotide monophosphatase NagD (HAD superfamily)